MEDKKIKEIKEKVDEIIKEFGVENLSAHDIREINLKPHMPLIGVKTMNYADKNMGIIDGDAPCSRKGCGLKLKEHKGDVVLFLYLSGVVDKADAERAMVTIEPTLKENKIDGIAFVQENESCVFKEGGTEQDEY